MAISQNPIKKLECEMTKQPSPQTTAKGCAS